MSSEVEGFRVDFAAGKEKGLDCGGPLCARRGHQHVYVKEKQEEERRTASDHPENQRKNQILDFQMMMFRKSLPTTVCANPT